MASMQGSLSIAAGATTANLLVGLPDEFCRFRRAAVRFLATAPTPGVTTYASIGSSVVCDNSQQPLVGQAAGRIVRPDDTLGQHGANAGDRITLKFTNTTVGAIVVTWAVDVQPF